MGVTMAHQSVHPPELNEAVRTSISTTAIKYCASPEGVDLNYMARDLKCEAAFLSQQQVTPTHVNFACYARGMGLQRPFIVAVPRGNIEQQPQMDEQGHNQLLAKNKERLSSPITHKAPVEGGLREPQAVRSLDAFDNANDPHKEHDFGSFKIDGETFFFKTDYYSPDMEGGSEDPSCPEKTTRVLTIMFASEY
jgi:hypothetical protein